MSFFKTLDISASALTAQSLRMDVIAQNVANANTTRTDDGTPYQRKTVILQERKQDFSNVLAGEKIAASNSGVSGGVEVSRILADETPYELVYDPSHPDSNDEGYVQMPNVDITREYVDMILASRSYEANITVMNTTKRMALKTFEIGK